MLFATVDELAKKQKEQEAKVKPPALVDDRSQGEALTSLLAPVMPQTPWEQAEEEYGAGGAALRRLGNLFTGGLFDEQIIPEYSSNNQAAYKQAVKDYGTQMTAHNDSLRQGQFLDGLDFNNLSLSQIAQLGDFDDGLGKLALENYTFNQRVGDLGRANEFRDDGIEDENDLWADEIYGRYGKTAGGETTSLDSVLGNAQMTREEFKALSPESQRAVLYQYGTDEDRKTMDRVAGRKTLDQIEAEAAAGQEGQAVGRQVGEDRQTLVGIRGTIQAQDQGIEKLSEIRNGLADGDVSTGWPRIIRDSINANTREDGTMDEATASGVIDLISQATFGALSQSELDLLKGGLMDPTKSTDYNIGTLDSAIERIQKEQEISYQKARDAAKRYEGNDDYEQLMGDDWMFQNVGAGSQIEDIPAFGGNDAYSFGEYVEETMSELGPFDQKPSREQLVAGFADQRKQAEEMYRAAQEREKAASQAANESWDWLTSPFPTASK